VQKVHSEEKHKRKRLGEILVEMGIITGDQVQTALKVQKKEGGLLGAVLIKLQFVTESDIAIALAKQDSIPYLPAQNCDVNMQVLSLVEPLFALKHQCLPIDKIENVLLLLTADPTQYSVVEELEKKTGLSVQLFVGIEAEVKQAIKRYYKVSGDEISLML
jgi:type IV pilus assembly protein PilB